MLWGYWIALIGLPKARMEVRLQVSADNGRHRVAVEATCDLPGTPLRAPTADSGLSPLCKDSFYGKVGT